MLLLDVKNRKKKKKKNRKISATIELVVYYMCLLAKVFEQKKNRKYRKVKNKTCFPQRRP